MKKTITVTIKADWTEEEIKSFKKWLDSELRTSNMGTGDDAKVISVKTTSKT